jgi:hypothetical protein
MEDLKSLAIGVLGGLIIIGLTKLFRAYRKKSLRDDIEFAEYEKNHLAAMKRSSVEMNRSSFRALFAVLMVMALANLVPLVFQVLELGLIARFVNFIDLLLWAIALGLAVKFWRRYDNLKHFKEATAKLDEKLELLRSKYENT